MSPLTGDIRWAVHLMRHWRHITILLINFVTRHVVQLHTWLRLMGYLTIWIRDTLLRRDSGLRRRPQVSEVNDGFHKLTAV
jgi:hypothetical protein